MIRYSIRLSGRCLTFGVCVVALKLLAGAAYGQSPVVFVTTQSSLVRFDNGIQTFSVGSGATDGVTILNNQVLTASGTIRRFSLSGSSLGNFASPAFNSVFVERDQAGNVYTTPDGGGPSVANRYDATGALTQTFNGGLEFDGIDADASGNVYISSSANFSLMKYAPNGTFINSTPLGFDPWDVSIDESGRRLFVADQLSAGLGIKIFDISGPAPILTRSIVTPLTARIAGVHYAAESGNILATDLGVISNSPRGLEYSPSGVLLRQYPLPVGTLAWDIVSFVPEPSSIVLCLLGFCPFLWRRRTAE